jgi:hypothetical protein
MRYIGHEDVGIYEVIIGGKITGPEIKMEYRFNTVDKRFENSEKQMKQDKHNPKISSSNQSTYIN